MFLNRTNVFSHGYKNIRPVAAMSDDGFADDAYSAYSDFEDLLYDADPAPDLADDLASHAIYSPIFADEPGYELQEYHSDWEYYSDDYFDDDPDLLRNNPQDGSPLKPQKQSKRGKKRKLADLNDIPKLDLGERAKLTDCIRGTVWAKPIARRDNTFRSGEEDKVALLKDWQKRFGTTSLQQPDKAKRPRLQTDESWANELSLVDMGLLNERGSRLDQAAGPQAAEDKEDDGEDEGDYEDEDQDEESKAALSEITEAMVDEAATTPELKGNLLQELDADSQVPQIYSQKLSRRTKDIPPSPPTSTESTTIEGDHPKTVIEDGSETRPAKRARGRPRKVQPLEDRDITTLKAANADGSDALITVNKKRKASASPPTDSKVNDHPGTRPIAPRRAKRMASNAIAGLPDSKNTPYSTTAAGTRSTRSKNRG